MAERLYRVSTKTLPIKHRLIKASTKNQVESKLTAETWDIEPADAVETADLMAAGVKVEATAAPQKAESPAA